MQVLEGKAIEAYIMGFRADATKETYLRKLRQFLASCNLKPDEFIDLVRSSPKEAERLMLTYMNSRRGEVTGSTLRGVKESIRAFLVMNDLQNSINWDKISKVMPPARKVGQDRAPSLEELRKIVESNRCDLRMRTIILLLCSGAFRVGAFDYLTWRDVQPITVGQHNFAKLTIYRGEPEQYTTFITPEAYSSLIEYRRRREQAEETITPESPLIRDVWDSPRPNPKHEVDPRMAKPVSSKTIKNLVTKLLWSVGLRKEHRRIQEFKAVHGFRKFFETSAKRVLRPDTVERLKGKITNYYKPSDEELANEHVKAIPYLTISEAAELKGKLQEISAERTKRLEELERENLMLKGRLQSLEDKLERLTELLLRKKS